MLKQLTIASNAPGNPTERVLVYKYAIFVHWLQHKISYLQSYLIIDNNVSVDIITTMFEGTQKWYHDSTMEK